MQTIEVTNCAECPFSDNAPGFVYMGCKADEKLGAFRLRDFTHAVHPFCPLKTNSITVKLAENDNAAGANNNR